MSDHRVTIRRSLHHHVDRLNGLSFTTDDADLAVSCCHVFDTDDAIAVSFVTGLGTINTLMPPALAQQLAAGLRQLLEQRNTDSRTGFDPIKT
jgi:hypothetical protein